MSLNSSTFRKSLGCIALAAFALAASAPVFAQETRATITGIVKDAQGAVVPGVTVTVVNTDTGVTTEDTTNEAGVFNIQKLPPGPVKVTAALSGFKTFVREGVTLRTAETVTLNVQLAVGGLEEVVTVRAELPSTVPPKVIAWLPVEVAVTVAAPSVTLSE